MASSRIQKCRLPDLDEVLPDSRTANLLVMSMSYTSPEPLWACPNYSWAWRAAIHVHVALVWRANDVGPRSCLSRNAHTRSSSKPEVPATTVFPRIDAAQIAQSSLRAQYGENLRIWSPTGKWSVQWEWVSLYTEPAFRRKRLVGAKALISNRCQCNVYTCV